MRIESLFTKKGALVRQFDVRKENIQKILLARTTFRMGNSILATPAILLFRKNFPHARIDFIGGPISRDLFQNLPIDYQYCITRRFPNASWAYWTLLKRIRSVGYDLAVEVSCSQSAMGSFIVGFSGSRFRVGTEGKWDRRFNVKIPRPPDKNKYKGLPMFLRCLGLDSLDGEDVLPSIVLSSKEKQEGWRETTSLVGSGKPPDIGIFVGGRISGSKRWPMHNFLQLIRGLHARGISVIVFTGPEEKDFIGLLRGNLKGDVPLVHGVPLRAFAGMISNCRLFVTCDSGPMHLACALGVRTVAIFQKSNFNRWGPPPSLGRIVYEPDGASPTEVLETCIREL